MAQVIDMPHVRRQKCWETLKKEVLFRENDHEDMSSLSLVSDIALALCCVFIKRWAEILSIDIDKHWADWSTDWAIAIDDVHIHFGKDRVDEESFDTMVIATAWTFLSLYEQARGSQTNEVH